MHYLLVGNVINYSLVGLPETKGYKCVFDTTLRQDCGVGFHPKKSIATQVFGFQKKNALFITIIIIIVIIIIIIIIIIINLSPRKCSCENTLAVPNLILITHYAKQTSAVSVFVE